MTYIIISFYIIFSQTMNWNFFLEENLYIILSGSSEKILRKYEHVSSQMLKRCMTHTVWASRTDVPLKWDAKSSDENTKLLRSSMRTISMKEKVCKNLMGNLCTETIILYIGNYIHCCFNIALRFYKINHIISTIKIRRSH